MVNDIKIEAAGWSGHARAYNLPSGQSLSFPMLQAAFKQHFFASLDEQVEGLPDGQKLKVLALCGGTGPETLLICQHLGARVDVLSTDTAQGMVDVCNEEIQAAGFEQYAKSTVMDAMNIEAADCSYDAVFLILGPMLLPDPIACFKQVSRVLKPSGRFYTLTPGRMDVHDVMTECKQRILAASGNGDRFQNTYANTILRTWGSPDVLKKKLEEPSLFADVHAYSVASTLSITDEKELDGVLSSMFTNPGMQKMYTGDLSEDEKEQFRQAVRTTFADRLQAGQDRDIEYGFTMHANCAYASKS